MPVRLYYSSMLDLVIVSIAYQPFVTDIPPVFVFIVYILLAYPPTQIAQGALGWDTPPRSKQIYSCPRLPSNPENVKVIPDIYG